MAAESGQKRNLWAVLVCGVLALYYTLPFLLRITYWGVRDWDLFTTVAAVPMGSILHYGQLPFWNPYLGGGNILFHHPEVLILSPFALLYLLFGAVIGLKLQVLVCYFVGFWGSHRLARSHGLSELASLTFAVIYFGSVHFALHFAEGHMPFTHFCFLPWFLYFTVRAGTVRSAVIGGAAMIALMILGNGAAIPLLYTLTFGGLIALLFAIQRRALVVLWRFLAATALGMGLAAVKVVPMAVYLIRNHWPGEPGETIPPGALASVFFGWNHSLFAQNFEGQVWAWHEYGAYISPLVVGLALIALCRYGRRTWPWLVAAGFFLLLGLGAFSPIAPWSLLSHLPGFGSARCTGRAFQFVIFGVGLLGAFGLDHIASVWRARSSWLRLVAPAVALVIVGTNLAFAWPIMSEAFRQPPKEVERHEEFRHVITDLHAYENYLANLGSLNTPWLSAYQPSRALVGPENEPYPEYVQSGEAEVISRRITPNEISYDLTVSKAGRMVISMGFDPGWRAADGRPLSAEHGLISFKTRSGNDRVRLSYRPPYLYPGLIVSVLCFCLVLWWWLSRPRTNALTSA